MENFEFAVNKQGEKILVDADIQDDTVKIPEDVVHIGDRAFQYSCVKKVIFPSGLKTIGENAFTCSWIEDAILPNGLEVIGDKAFFCCHDLKSVEIPDSVKHIGKYAFYGCDGLKSVEIPDSVKHIGTYAFYSCPELENVKLPKGLQTLGKDVFENCFDLPPMKLPKSPNKQSRNRKPAREIVAVADSIECFTTDAENIIGGLKNKSIKYKSVVIPDGVHTISSGAFYNANMQTVILPDKLRVIKERAFANCVNFRKIFIPSSVVTIEKDAFAGCKLLKIYCEGEPKEDWIDLPDAVNIYYENMTEAFNFHRSAGSFDELYLVEQKEIIRNTYNPEKRPVYTNVSRDEFIKLL